MAKKKTHGEGSTWKLKNGTWRGQLMDGYTEDGKKHVISFSGATKAEVLDKIREYQNGLAAHVHLDKSITLEDFGETWYEDYESQVQPSTFSTYRYTLNLIKTRLGQKAIADVLPLDINRFQDQLAKDGYSLSQIRKCRTMLIQIFDAADNNGLILRNPARKSKIIKDRDGKLGAPRRLKDAFTDDELDKLEHGLNEDLLGHSIRLMLDTGLRTEELLALSPASIAPDGSTVTVSHAIQMAHGKPQLGPPKSKKSARTIPVPQSARRSAIFLREHGGEQLIWSLPGRNPLYSVGSFRRRYYNAIGQIDGVRKLSPHCCRHTYATRLQAKGVPIELAALLLGHGSVDVTIGYEHASLSTLSSEVAKLDTKEEAEDAKGR